MTKDEIRDRITFIFGNLFPSAPVQDRNLVPQTLTDGKLYEAYVVTLVAERLSLDEGYQLTLVNSNHLQLKSSHGPINRTYPSIYLRRSGSVAAELWTDIEYLTLSYSSSGRSTPRKGTTTNSTLWCGSRNLWTASA